MTATQVLCLLSLDTGAVIPTPPELRQRFERYAEKGSSSGGGKGRAARRGDGAAGEEVALPLQQFEIG